MMSTYFFMSLGLALVLEGIFPFLNPPGWRRVMISLGKQPNGFLRFLGLVSMLTGLLIVFITHTFFS